MFDYRVIDIYCDGSMYDSQSSGGIDFATKFTEYF